jgi:hypothetical protein
MRESEIVTKAKEQLKDFNAARFTEENHLVLHPKLVQEMAEYIEKNREDDKNPALGYLPATQVAMDLLAIVAEYQMAQGHEPVGKHLSLSAWHSREHIGPLVTLSSDMPQAYLPGLGTIRECLDCKCLVAGGPTRCLRCANEVKINRVEL